MEAEQEDTSQRVYKYLFRSSFHQSINQSVARCGQVSHLSSCIIIHYLPQVCTALHHLPFTYIIFFSFTSPLLSRPLVLGFVFHPFYFHPELVNKIKYRIFLVKVKVNYRGCYEKQGGSVEGRTCGRCCCSLSPRHPNVYISQYGLYVRQRHSMLNQSTDRRNL